MEIIRDKINKVLSIKNNNSKVIEISYLENDISITLFSSDPICINKETDPVLYNNFCFLVDNEYDLESNKLSNDNNRLIWASDDYFDDCKVYPDETNHLIIKKTDEKIKFMTYNPRFEKNNWKKEYNLILFSKEKDSNNILNKNTGNSLFTDIEIVFNSTLNNIMINNFNMKKRSVK